MGTMAEWDGTSHVDDSVLNNDTSSYIGAESLVLAAGPPTVAQIGGEGDGGASTNWGELETIGVVQNLGMAQSRQLQQLFELGSAESYFIPGKTFVNVSLSRVLIHGPNLLKALYKNTNDYTWETSGKNNPGAEESSYFYINLASDFFARPLGLLIAMQDIDNDDYAATYLENCFIQSHQISMTASQSLIMENVAIRCSKAVPLAGVSDSDTIIFNNF